MPRVAPRTQLCLTAVAALACASAWAQTPASQRVEVTGTAERDNPAIAAGALRTPMPIEKIPQSVSVIGRELIDEQGAQSLTEALRNASAVRGTDPRDMFNFGLRIRGFEAGVTIDGLALPGQFTTPDSLAGVRRIEVVKGPVGTMFGGSQSAGNSGFVGGLVAVTTESPQPRASASAGARLGTRSEGQLWVDVNQPLGPTLAVRLVGDMGHADSETDLVTHEREAWQGSLAWRPSPGSELLVRLRHSGSQGRDTSGLPRKGTTEPAAWTVPRSRIVTAEGVPDADADTDSLNLQWSQRLDAHWSWGLLVGRVRAEMDQPGVFALDSTTFAWPSNDGPLYTLSGARLWNRMVSTVVSPSLTGRFGAGGATHTLLAGIDLDRTNDDAYLRFSPNFGLLGFFDITRPVYPAWADPDVTGTPDQRNRYRSTGAYLQHHADFGALQITGSVRHNRVTVDDVNPAFGVDNHSTNGKTLLRAGAAYALSPQVSVFAGWGQGMRVPTFANFSTPPKPELSAQAEMGLRITKWNGLTASASLFDLELKNALVADPVNVGRTIQVGKKRSRGVDIDLQWQVSPALRALASLTRQDPTIVDTGKQTVDVPKTSARLAVRYDLGAGSALPGAGFGLGLTHHSALPGDAANSYFTPSATVFDAQASWQVSRVTLGLVVNNLADKQYFVPSRYFGGGQVTPAPRRSVAATARLDF